MSEEKNQQPIETSSAESPASSPEGATKAFEGKASRTGDQGVFLQPVGSHDSNPFGPPVPILPIPPQPTPPQASQGSESASEGAETSSSGQGE